MMEIDEVTMETGGGKGQQFTILDPQNYSSLILKGHKEPGKRKTGKGVATWEPAKKKALAVPMAEEVGSCRRDNTATPKSKRGEPRPIMPPGAKDRTGKDISEAFFENLYRPDSISSYEAYWQPKGGIHLYCYDELFREDDRSHRSGWAYENSNNKCKFRLRKSCIGVMVCAECQATYRPETTSRAHKQVPLGLKCEQCLDGRLVHQPCKGKNGKKPVTQTWLSLEEGLVYVKNEGAHDHPTPPEKYPRIWKKKIQMGETFPPPMSIKPEPQVAEDVGFGQMADQESLLKHMRCDAPMPSHPDPSDAAICLGGNDGSHLHDQTYKMSVFSPTSDGSEVNLAVNEVSDFDVSAMDTRELVESCLADLSLGSPLVQTFPPWGQNPQSVDPSPPSNLFASEGDSLVSDRPSSGSIPTTVDDLFDEKEEATIAAPPTPDEPKNLTWLELVQTTDPRMVLPSQPSNAQAGATVLLGNFVANESGYQPWLPAKNEQLFAFDQGSGGGGGGHHTQRGGPGTEPPARRRAGREGSAGGRGHVARPASRQRGIVYKRRPGPVVKQGHVHTGHDPRAAPRSQVLESRVNKPAGFPPREEASAVNVTGPPLPPFPLQFSDADINAALSATSDPNLGWASELKFLY